MGIIHRVVYRWKLSGTGATIKDVYKALFGSSPASKAFRELVKLEYWGQDPIKATQAKQLEPLAAAVIDIVRGSQPFKTLCNEAVDMSLNFGLRGLDFIQGNTWDLPYFKRVLDAALGKEPSVSRDTQNFLRKWVNTDGSAMPKPAPYMIQELLPYRLDTTSICYRGMRFSDIGAMAEFHTQYAEGKMFPFESKFCSSWSLSFEVAKKFGSLPPAETENQAMSSWFDQVQSKKNYAGTGGYVIGARVRPADTLVSLGRIGVGPTDRVGEGEVIVLDGTKLVAKVYAVYGDVERELQEYFSKNPTSYDRRREESFVGLATQGLLLVKKKREGDSSILQFKKDPVYLLSDPSYAAKSIPQIFKDSDLQKALSKGDEIVKWLNEATVVIAPRA